MSGEETNLLDNNRTKLYKYAYKHGLPINFTLINNKGKIKNLKEDIRLFQDTMQDLKVISNKYNICMSDVLFFIYLEELPPMDLVNEVFSLENLPPVKDVREYIEMKDSWERTTRGKILEVIILYSRIVSTQNHLFLHSGASNLQQIPKKFDVSYNKSTISYKVLPSIKGNIYWDIGSISDVIDNITTSPDIPFAHSQINEEGKHIYKLFVSEEANYVHDPQIFLSFTKDKHQIGNVYIYVWNGGNIETKTSYNECIYNGKDNYLEITSNIDAENVSLEFITENIKDKVLLAMPFFKFSDPIIKNINGRLSYPNVRINLNIFYFMIDQDPILSSYFTLVETTSIRSSEKKVLVEYNNVIPDSSKIFLKFSSKLIDNISYLIVNVIRAGDKKEIEEVGNIISYLIIYYNKNYEYYLEFIQNNIGDVLEGDKIDFEIITSKGKLLSLRAPEVFDMNEEGVSYNRNICQKIKQPIIIDDDEIDSWEKMLIDGKKRQIAQFPPPREGVTKLFNYVCPNDNFPYPTLSENKFNGNKEQFPMLPCCGKDDRYSEYINENKGKFLKYYSGEKDYQKNKIVSNKNPIKETYFGWLPVIIRSHLDMSEDIGEYMNNINKLLIKNTERESDDIDGGNISSLSLYMKYSVGGNNDSFISCVLWAMNSDENVSDVRKKLAELNLSLYSQENLYLKEESLRKQILEGYIDPLLLYRGLEELYDINIYIFDSRENEILLPYFKVNHIREERSDRRCILIWHYPQHQISELIVKLDDLSSQSKRTPQKIFSEKIGKRLYSNIQKVYLLLNKDILIDPFPLVSWGKANLYMKDWTFVAQKIDENKKCRGLLVKKGESLLNVYFPPAQPINLPTMKKEEEKIKGRLTDAISLVGYDPYSRTDDGVWFSLKKQKEVLFIPIEDIPDIRISSLESPISNTNEIGKEIERVSEITKITSDLESLTWWLFLLENNTKPTVEKFTKWWEEYVVLIDKININYTPIEKLTISKNTKEGISYVNKFYPSIFKENKINITSRCNYGLKNTLTQKVKENVGLNLPIPTFISKKYDNEKDFNNDNCRVFLSKENLETWIQKTLGSKNYKNFIKSMIDVNNSREISYFKYRTHIYIIQRENNIKDAIFNSFQFPKSKINLFTSGASDNQREKKYPYVLYVMKDGKLLVSEDHSDNEDIRGEILEDMDTIYSLLRLTN